MGEPLALPQAFTTETARIMAARSWEIRRKRAAERAAAEPEAQLTPPPSEPADKYVEKRIARARAQIERLEALSMKVTDALELDRLARAVSNWVEIERVLSGRPLPGSRRPGKEKGHAQEEVKPL